MGKLGVSAATLMVAMEAVCAAAIFAAPPPVELVNVYEGGISLADYWVSEKYDGVRGYWDGHQLISRGGNAFNPPAWFTKNWPDTPMDGELWGGRGRFAQTSGTVRAQTPDDAAWRNIHYMVFDLPAMAGPFDARVARMRQLAAQPHSSNIYFIEQFRVADEAALQVRMHAVVAGGGEGLVLHRGAAVYRAGRTGDLLKLKPYQDAEARVIGYVPGQGRNTGRMGSLLVEQADGTRFHLGTGFTDKQREHPPAIGSWVSYRYNGLTSHGLPRFARFLRVREYLPPPDSAVPSAAAPTTR